MTLEQWLQEGIDKGFCTTTYCGQHDGHAQEDGHVLSQLFAHSGGDHCITLVRIKTSELEDQLEHYEDEAAEEKRGLEEPVVDFL